MSGVANSFGGFLGTSSGPGGGPAGNFSNSSLDALDNETGNVANNGAAQGLYNTAQQTGDVQSALNQVGGLDLNSAQQMGLDNNLATGATTGSQYAAQVLGNNGTQNSLYGSNGQLGNTENLINQEEQVGTQLNPTSNTLYGQEAGQIANQFGQQNNQAAQDLASRGLSDSGAAGATFSGIAGNQNQMLANAQEQIGQQQFSNAQQQLQNNMNYATQLGSQYNNALNQQYGRQATGEQQQVSGLENASEQQQGANNAENNYNNTLFNQGVANTPMNFADFATAGLGQGLQSGLAGSSGSQGSSTDSYDANGNFTGSKVSSGTAGSGVAGLFG